MISIPFLIKSAAHVPPMVIPIEPVFIEIGIEPKLSDDAFFDLCVKNHPLRIERNKHGKIIIMTPIGFDGGQYEGEVFGKIYNWRESLGKGWVTNPSVAFKLPDGSTHAPDAAWISDDKIAKLTPEQRKKFPPVVPDFVIEVRSQSDRLKKLKQKMEKVWMANGVRLAWLLDPLAQKAYIYRQDGSKETITGFTSKLSGEEVCPGFEFDLGLLVL